MTDNIFTTINTYLKDIPRVFMGFGVVSAFDALTNTATCAISKWSSGKEQEIGKISVLSQLGKDSEGNLIGLSVPIEIGSTLLLIGSDWNIHESLKTGETSIKLPPDNIYDNVVGIPFLLPYTSEVKRVSDKLSLHYKGSEVNLSEENIAITATTATIISDTVEIISDTVNIGDGGSRINIGKGDALLLTTDATMSVLVNGIPVPVVIADAGQNNIKG